MYNISCPICGYAAQVVQEPTMQVPAQKPVAQVPAQKPVVQVTGAPANTTKCLLYFCHHCGWAVSMVRQKF